MTDDDVDLDAPDENDKVVRRAHKRFRRCQEWEGNARARWLDDVKFDSGDCYNNYQWPTEIYDDRGSRPSLTINKTAVHNRHIINDAKQNKSGIKYRPIGDGATAEAALVWEGIARHIENNSHAQSNAYGPAIEFQVKGGLGFTRVITDYVDGKSFDQEIYIAGVQNVLGTYLDPDAREKNGSDARFGFYFVDLAREEAERKYPEHKDKLTAANAVDGEEANWLREDHVREAEYYEIEEENDTLLGAPDGTVILQSEVPAELLAAWEAEAEEKGETIRKRPTITKKVWWYKIVGAIVVDKTEWPGTTIPVVPWLGEVTVIDGQLDRKGHTRALIGPQQMLNYNRSAEVEYGALQSKTPYIAPTEAIDDYLSYWSTANTVNHAYLPYRSKDENGDEIRSPQRQEPPAAAPVFSQGAQSAEQDMQLASGQYDAELGAPGNEKSGRAINERQRQSERATYHFVDNQAAAIRRIGEIILEIAPRVYDTKRILRIIKEDGSESHVTVDPNHDQAHSVDDNGNVTFNPTMGKYEVISDVGPDYATQRQEAFNAIVQILTQAPALIDRIGDLLFRVADFPLAAEIAERLKPGLAPDAQKAIEELQKQLQAGNKRLGEAMQALTEERLKAKGKDQEAVIDAFDADTKRLSALQKALPMDPAQLQQLISETIRQALQDNLGPAVTNATDSLQAPGGAGTGQMPIAVPNPGEQAASIGGV